MSYTDLIDWYESQDVEGLNIDEFGDFTEIDIEDAILEFGVAKGSQDKDIARRKLRTAISITSPDIFNKVKESRKFIGQIASIKDLKTIITLIDRNVQAPLATRIGIERARTTLKNRKNLFTDEGDKALDFLKKYEPTTAGGFIRQRQEIGKAFRGTFE